MKADTRIYAKSASLLCFVREKQERRMFSLSCGRLEEMHGTAVFDEEPTHLVRFTSL
jgi:hypothetical protein